MEALQLLDLLSTQRKTLTKFFAALSLVLLFLAFLSQG